ncbi:hypothetical protein NHX12_022872 [Muraenolepis orangiensis]|uniref:DUF4201 domain-containing protein n=1 Tax=Muraenolepis orangiensis TaxID=630683 RepID=A0A9Q0IVI0_9TELE|nr:hypothetical protein NHX12_022872 [Muraenolepis orangiensis]
MVDSDPELAEMAQNKSTTTAEEEKQQLIGRVEELKRSNVLLRAENDMLEEVLSRQGPQDSGPQPPGGHQLLSLEQKVYVTQKQVAETMRDIEEAQHRKMIQDNDKAVNKEVDLRLSELQRERFAFQCHVLKPLKENKGKMDTDKVLRFIEDGIKRKDAQVEKLCVNRAHYLKLQRQLKQNTGMDDDLQEANIKNRKHQEKTAKRKEELQRLKQLGATTLKNLNAIKQCAQEKALCERLRNQLDDYSAPDLMEYVQVKDRQKGLQRTFHVWERKVDISEMVLKSYTKAWKSEKADYASVNNTAAGVSRGYSMAVLRLPKIN